MTEQAILSKMQKCRICGFVGLNVSAGVWKSTKDRYHVILRCDDHDACISRKIELERR